MKREELQHLLISTIIFAVILGIALFFVEIEEVETTYGRIVTVIIASLIFFGVSYLLVERRRSSP